MRAVAKGVRRTKSKFGARLEPFSHVDLQLYTGRNLDIVTQAESRSAPTATSSSATTARYTAGTAVLETAERLTAEEREPSLRLYLLVVGALRALAEGEKPAPLVLDAFLLRAMSVAGWAPALGDCARCGAAGPHRPSPSRPAAWSARPAGPPARRRPARPPSSCWRRCCRGDWDRAEASQGITRREASGLVAAQLQWHLERGLRSLPLVDRT